MPAFSFAWKSQATNIKCRILFEESRKKFEILDFRGIMKTTTNLEKLGKQIFPNSQSSLSCALFRQILEHYHYEGCEFKSRQRLFRLSYCTL